jgi:hypothetical protein
MKEQWIYDQFSTIDVSDARLQRRAVDIAKGCAKHPEESLVGCFDEWADLKAHIASLVILKSRIKRFNNLTSTGIGKGSLFGRDGSFYSRWLRVFVQFSSMDTRTWPDC